MNNDKAKSIRRIIYITLAWISLPILGVALLSITTNSSTMPVVIIPAEANQDTSIVTLNGLLGVILVTLLIITTYRLRKNAYFYHLRIGLWIGLGIYSMILISGIIDGVNGSSATTDTNTCTTPQDQFINHGSAIVPIGTDSGFGTGFAVSDNTTILTANHVIEGANSIEANYSSGRVKLEVIDTAPQYDLALLRIEKPTDSFFTLSDTYVAGDEVYAYGYPSNALTAGPPSLSKGIISRVVDLANIRLTTQEAPDGLELIQTDAAINPGNSGGPLVGSCGVIGIVSFASDTSQLSDYIGQVSEQNIGYAISSKTITSAFRAHLVK